MNLIQTLRRWKQAMSMLTATGEEPPFVPLTREEIEIIKDPREQGSVGYFTGGPWRIPTDEVLGLKVHETSFAVMQRQRMVTMPLCHLEETANTSLNFVSSREEDYMGRYLRRRLEAKVCCDTTKLFFRMEFDPLAKLKRALRITRWFPVKYRNFAIEGKVLYPYLNVTLPHNRHNVHFAVRPS